MLDSHAAPTRSPNPDAGNARARRADGRGVGLVKRYGSFTAVDGIDVRIEQGETFGFLGPNGAGKTSTMKMISCMSPVTEGSLRVLGRDPATDGPPSGPASASSPRRTTSSSSCRSSTTSTSTGATSTCAPEEILERAERLLDFAQLTDRRDDKADSLSGGMKRRLTIARALVSDPDLLILDEPTTGLDPQARHLLWERLYRLKAEGVTLIITTHYMDEAEQLCDRLVVMDRGRIVALGTPRCLIDRTRPRRCSNCASASTATASAQGWQAWPNESRPCPTACSSTWTMGTAPSPRCTQGFMPEWALVRRSTLEDVFLRLTGRTLVD